MSDAVFRALLDTASAAYRPAGPFAYHFARGKLGADPLFRLLLQRGMFPAAARVVDLGCGQGLLASWLLAARGLYECGRWAREWPAPPRLVGLRGVDRNPRDVARARRALAEDAAIVEIRQGDIATLETADFGPVDVVTILDVLHYLDFAAQERLLRKVRDALPAGGRLFTRVGDADAGLPHRLSTAVDLAVAFARGHRLPRLYCRSSRSWTALLEGLGFLVHGEPMGSGKSFANVMLVAQVPF
ncbi:class I SAM-dependent methyltransferase [Aromatoleum anaerobium]|uniref:Methyltransferase domain-containing protein n=1 Tax=Aromatoleum anaerobium TaxID=182180 RepID=A0ABX1PKZ2_9RHOO|nr:class I SAM-dependent methyltransferase [Aromatoleum anaerobium]MCK0508412.1 class I SAM-dependent methyltransferase [Aromatoleum anaerobium]